MSKPKVVSIQKETNKPKLIAKDSEGHRIIIGIGSQRMALDFHTGRRLAGLHPGLQALARRPERLNNDACPVEARATVEDDIATGVALFYICHSNELILSD